MAEYKITAIRKSAPGTAHENITHIYGPKLDDPELTYVDLMIRVASYVESGNHRFFIEKDGANAYTEVRTLDDGAKVLQVQIDGVWTDDLLHVPEKAMEDCQITAARRTEGDTHGDVTHFCEPQLADRPDSITPAFLIVDRIETEKMRYYVESGANKVFLAVRAGDDGQKFIQAQTDGEWSDEVLELPSC